MKTPVYDGEEGKISPSCPIWESTLGVSMLLEKAALRRLILPAVLRELFLTGCVLKPVVLAHCEETCCCSWSHDSTAEEVACPKRALLIQLATQRECCVTSTSMRCLVFSGLRLRHTRRNSCSSLTQASHASQNKWKTRRYCEEASMFVLARITFVLHRADTL